MGRNSRLPEIIAALEHAPAGLTQIELQRITGVCQASVSRHVHLLHDKGEVHIAGWKTGQTHAFGGCVYQARYKLGSAADVPKPPVLTAEEIQERYRARVRSKSGALAELRAKRAEAQKRRNWKAKPVRRDPMIAALFGSPMQETSHA
jgi:hypothetical protein